MAELIHFYDEENTLGVAVGTISNTAFSGSNPAQILGSALTANTKYLIVARAVHGAENNNVLKGIRVQTDDDSTIETKSFQDVEFQKTTVGEYISYFFVHSFTTSATPTDVEIQFDGSAGTDGRVDQSSLFLLDLDAIGTDRSFFDGTTSDPNTVWTDDANAADGSESTFAFSTSGGGSSDYLEINGTGITELKGQQTRIRILMDRNSSVGTWDWEIRDGGTLIHTGARTTGPNAVEWTPWFTITAPSGGWTLAKLQGLEIRLSSISTAQLDIYKVEIENSVYFEDVQPASGDEYSTSAATTILAEIAGSDMGTDEHLILGYARADVGSTGRWFDISLETAMDASSNAEVAKHRAEGEDTAEQRIVGFAARHKASSGTPNATLYGSEEAANGNMLDGGAYLIALPTALFADFEFDYTAGALDVDPEATVASVGPYTPSVNGNHLLFGGATSIVGAQAGAFAKLHLEDGTTETRTGDQAVGHSQIWDAAKDVERAVTFERISQSAEKTWNLRATRSGGIQPLVDDRWLIVVNLNEPAAGGQTIAVPFASESETAQVVDPVKPIIGPVPLASESETVQVITGVKTAQVPVASETETAQVVVPTKAAQIPTASEVEAAQVITPVKPITETVPFAAEVEAAQAVVAVKVAQIPTAAEIETSQVVTPVKPIIEAVPLASEVDAAQAIPGIKTGSVPTASETEAAQVVTPVQSQVVAVPPTTETEIAQAVAAVKTGQVPVATETETAQVVDPVKPITEPVPLASETEAAQAVAPVKSAQIPTAPEVETAQVVDPVKPIIEPVPTASETELARVVAAIKVVQVPTATEVETAQAIAAVKPIIQAVSFAAETETGQVVAALKTAAVGTATESETAQAVVPVQSIIVAVPVASETEAAQLVAGIKTAAVPFASETETAQVIDVVQAIIVAVPFATETELAQLVAAIKTGVIPTASETETAQVVVPVKPIIEAVPTALEAEVAQLIGAVKIAQVPTAVESETAQIVVGIKTAQIPTASEAETAQLLVGIKTGQIPGASESEAAQVIDVLKPSSVAVPTAAEVEAAQIVDPLKPISLSVPAAVETETGQLIAVVKVVPVPFATESEAAQLIDVVLSLGRFGRVSFAVLEIPRKPGGGLVVRRGYGPQ